MLLPFQLKQPYEDAFVTRLSSTGTILYSSYLGGSDSDFGLGIAVDSTGAAYVTGSTGSPNFPTTLLGPCGANSSNTQAFVTKLAPQGSGLLYSRCLGGMAEDTARAITLVTNNAAIITGYTNSQDFPTVLAFQPFHAGRNDAFITKISPSGATLLYSSFLGGAQSDVAFSIAPGNNGSVWVGGITASSLFPRVGSFGPYGGGSYDGFVARISQLGDMLEFSTTLGGSSTDYVWGIGADGTGGIYATGFTQSTNFPVTGGAVQPFYPGGASESGFVTHYTSAGARTASTFLGGAGGPSRGYAIRSALGGVYVTGTTVSTLFPIVNPAWAPIFAGGNRGFLTKLNTNLTSITWSTFVLPEHSSMYPEAIALTTTSGFPKVYVAGSTRPEEESPQDVFVQLVDDH
jgi:hypothetical protein